MKYVVLVNMVLCSLCPIVQAESNKDIVMEGKSYSYDGNKFNRD